MQRAHRVLAAAGTAAVVAASGGAAAMELREGTVDAWAAGQPGGDGLFR